VVLFLLNILFLSACGVALILRYRARRRMKMRAQSAMMRPVVVATMEAVRRGHAVATPEHLLIAALADPAVAGAPFTPAVREQVAHLLDQMETRPGVTTGTVSMSQPALDALTRAVRRAAMRGSSIVSAADLLEALRATEGPVGTLLVGKPTPLLAPPPIEPAVPSTVGGYRSAVSSRARVVLWDDSKTTMAQVVDVLEKHFALSPAEAAHLMLDVHEDGSRSIGTYPADDAAERVAKATTYLRELGIPLRITLDVETGTSGGSR
jgi:ATP-dependent Clp protease adapter protein ClpS